MKEMKTLKFPNQEEAYEIVDAYAREQIETHTHDFSELTINDTESAKTALAIENGVVLKNLQATIPISDNWYSIAYGNGKFVSVSYNYKVVYSEDGINWYTSKLADSASYGAYYVIYANGKFIATCSYKGSSIYYSDDGITWTKQTLTGASGLRIAYGNNIFVALNCGGGGQSNTAYYSDDAINWTAVTISPDRWNNIVYGNGRFIILSYNSLSAYYSDDGINWNPTSLSSRCYNTTAAYGNGKFVVTLGSASAKIMYSEDGINWSNATLPVSGTYKVTYGNNKFVMVDENSNTVLYSEDGVNWNSTLSPSTGSRSVAYCNDRFVAMPYQGTNVTFSYDGITWYDSIQYISQNDTDVTADTLAVLKHTHDEYLTEQVQSNLSQTDSTQVDYVKGIIRKESLPEGYPYKEGVTFEYDGVATGRPVVGGAVKISDAILDYETFQKVVVDYYDGEELKASITPMAVVTEGGAGVYVAQTTEIDGNTLPLAIMVYEANNALRAETGLYVLAVEDWRAVLRFETIHPMAPEFLPAAATAQADWNQNDETAPDYVKNRTHYVIKPEETIFQWDGNTEGLEKVEVTVQNTYKMFFYKLFDDTNWAIQEDVNVTLLQKQGDTNNVTTGKLTPSYNNNLLEYSAGISAVEVVFEDSRAVQFYGQSVTLTKGTWAMIMDESSFGYTGYIQKIDTIPVYQKIPNHFLPAPTINAGTGENSEVFNGLDSSAASGDYSHAEGNGVTASSSCAHAEGDRTTASGNCSHAEGSNTTASGICSHAEGAGTTASGLYSHVEGIYNIASGKCSHAEGYETTANSKSQHTQGEYNIFDTENITDRGTYAHIVGNGTSDSARSNAHTLDWSGNAWFAGDVYVGSTSGTNKDEGSVKLMKEVTGTQGQIIGFDADSNAVAQDLSTIATDLGAARVQTGSYVGTGGSGTEANACKITCNFVPKLVVIVAPLNSNAQAVTLSLVYGSTQFQHPVGTSWANMFATWSGNTVSWFTTGNVKNQMNVSGQTYYWVAFG